MSKNTRTFYKNYTFENFVSPDVDYSKCLLQNAGDIGLPNLELFFKDSIPMTYEVPVGSNKSIEKFFKPLFKDRTKPEAFKPVIFLSDFYVASRLETGKYQTFNNIDMMVNELLPTRIADNEFFNSKTTNSAIKKLKAISESLRGPKASIKEVNEFEDLLCNILSVPNHHNTLYFSYIKNNKVSYSGANLSVLKIY